MDKQSAPQRKYHPPYEDECPAQPMSEEEALRKLRNDNPYDFNDQNFSFKAYDNGLFAAWEVAAALRKEPPALPAEVEAVVANILDFCREHETGRPMRHTVIWEITNANGTFSISREQLREAATLLRRYAQAVAEKDADRKHFRARVFLASSGGSFHSTGCTIWGDDGQGHTEEGFTQPLPCNCGALVNFHKKEVATLQSEAREKDAEIARLTGIEKRAKSYRALLTPGSYCEISECQVFDDMTAILWEEH